MKKKIMQQQRVILYPKITASGRQKFSKPGWYLEEKIDGSQLSFGLNGQGELEFFNRGRKLTFPYGWFFDAAISALSCLKGRLLDGYMFHGECIARPKHNIITYGRVPKFFFILFDATTPTGEYVSRAELERLANQVLEVECAQLVYQSTADDDAPLPTDAFIHSLSFKPQLGGAEEAEGVVLKHPASSTKYKFVRTEFKETHRKGNAAHPLVMNGNVQLTSDEAIDMIMSWYSKEARWNKALFRLRDQGLITGEPENAAKERTKIMAEARRDFQEEEQENLKNLLWAVFGKKLVEKITQGY